MLLNGHTFVAVYDASESHEGKSSDDLMLEALEPAPGEVPGPSLSNSLETQE